MHGLSELSAEPPRHRRTRLLDEHYDIFGAFLDTGQIPFLGLTDPLTESPSAPRGFLAGVRVTF